MPVVLGKPQQLAWWKHFQNSQFSCISLWSWDLQSKIVKAKWKKSWSVVSSVVPEWLLTSLRKSRGRGTALGYKSVSQHTFKCLVTYHVAKTSISNWAHVSNTTAEPEGITRTLCLTPSSFYTLHLWITFIIWKQSSQQVKKDNCVFRNHFWAQSQPSKLGPALLKFKKLEQYKK